MSVTRKALFVGERNHKPGDLTFLEANLQRQHAESANTTLRMPSAKRRTCPLCNTRGDDA